MVHLVNMPVYLLSLYSNYIHRYVPFGCLWILFHLRAPCDLYVDLISGDGSNPGNLQQKVIMCLRFLLTPMIASQLRRLMLASIESQNGQFRYGRYNSELYNLFVKWRTIINRTTDITLYQMTDNSIKSYQHLWKKVYNLPLTQNYVQE